MENSTTAGATLAVPEKPMTPVAEAHTNLVGAHNILSEELGILENKLKDALRPATPSDGQKEPALQSGVSFITSIVQQETNNVHGFIARVRNLIERLEV